MHWYALSVSKQKVAGRDFNRVLWFADEVYMTGFWGVWLGKAEKQIPRWQSKRPLLLHRKPIQWNLRPEIEPKAALTCLTIMITRRCTCYKVSNSNCHPLPFQDRYHLSPQKLLSSLSLSRTESTSCGPLFNIHSVLSHLSFAPVVRFFLANLCCFAAAI